MSRKLHTLVRKSNCVLYVSSSSSSSTALRPVFGPLPPQPSSSTTPYLLLQPSSSESGAGWLHPSVCHLPTYFVVSTLDTMLCVLYVVAMETIVLGSKN
jgi:hypothetical protein